MSKVISSQIQNQLSWRRKEEAGEGKLDSLKNSSCCCIWVFFRIWVFPSFLACLLQRRNGVSGLSAMHTEAAQFHGHFGWSLYGVVWFVDAQRVALSIATRTTSTSTATQSNSCSFSYSKSISNSSSNSSSSSSTCSRS